MRARPLRIARPRVTREAYHERISNLAGVDSAGGILPPPDFGGIDRASNPWWRTTAKDYRMYDHSDRAAQGGEKCGDAINRATPAMREATIGEFLDRRIDKFERVVRALRDLKASLPGNYLDSGASRISALLEP
jgi:hypothetical protein